MKKFATLFLALALSAGLAIPAFAMTSSNGMMVQPRASSSFSFAWDDMYESSSTQYKSTSGGWSAKISSISGVSYNIQWGIALPDMSPVEDALCTDLVSSKSTGTISGSYLGNATGYDLVLVGILDTREVVKSQKASGTWTA